MTTDLLGTAFSPEEQSLFDAYTALKDLAGRDLPPCAASNVKVALAALAVAVTDLALDYEHLTDLGC